MQEPPLAAATERARRFAVVALMAMGLVASGTACGAGDPVAGKMKAAPCGACHGVDGNSTNPQWPNLAGQHAQYLVRQLEGFKAGARKDPLMSPMVAPLSRQDMEDIAAYFARQKCH